MPLASLPSTLKPFQSPPWAAVLPPVTQIADEAAPLIPNPLADLRALRDAFEQSVLPLGLRPLPTAPAQTSTAPRPVATLPATFSTPPAPRAIFPTLPDVTESTATNVGLGGAEGAAIKTAFGIALEKSFEKVFGNIEGIGRPVNVLDKLKAARLAIKSRPGGLLTADERALRASLTTRIITFTAAGAIAGEILAGSEAAAGEEKAIQLQEAVALLGVLEANGQRTALTVEEQQRVQSALGNDILTRTFVNEFNAQAQANAQQALAGDALALSRVVLFNGLGMLEDAIDPRTGLRLTFPGEKADP